MANIKLIGTNLVDPYYPEGTLNYALASKFKAIASGYSTTFKVYSGSISGSAKFAIYADSSGVPGNKLYGDDTARTISSYGWQDVIFPKILLTYNVDYWLVIRQSVANIACFDSESGGSIVSGSLPWANSWPTTLTLGSPIADYSYGLAVWGIPYTPGIIGGILPNL
jgi:hypothetical protein